MCFSISTPPHMFSCACVCLCVLNRFLIVPIAFFILLFSKVLTKAVKMNKLKRAPTCTHRAFLGVGEKGEE